MPSYPGMTDDAGSPPIHLGTVRVVIMGLLVAALVTAVYWPVLRAQALSLDDTEFVINNPLVTNPSWASTAAFFAEVLKPSTVGGYYLPLSMTSLMLDHAVGGRLENLLPFHRTSLMLHALNAVLIGLIVYSLFGALIPAGIAALMFGLHPLTVEPVAWIGERKTLLASFFALAAILTYVRYRRWPMVWWLVLSVLCYALALISKPTVLPLPLLLLLIDYWPLKGVRLRTVIRAWPFLLLASVSAAITLISHARTASVEMSLHDILQWPLRAGYLLSFYLSKIVRPIDLATVYQGPSSWSLSHPPIALGLGLVLGLTVLSVIIARPHRWLLAGWLFFVLAIGPTLGLVKYSWVVASDKYTYLPTLGIVLVMGAGLSAAWRVEARPMLVRPVLLTLAALVLTLEGRGVRNALRPWTDSLTLATHIVAVSPNAAAAHHELGAALETLYREDEALAAYRRAIALDPRFGDAYYNMGRLLARRGDINMGTRYLRRAGGLIPGGTDVLYELGIAAQKSGQLEVAAEYFRRAIAMRPGYIEAVDRLGVVLVLQGRVQEGTSLLRGSLELAPRNAHTHLALAVVLLRLGGSQSDAVDHLRQAIRYQPSWAEPYNELAWALATDPHPPNRDPAEALRLGTRAVELTRQADPSKLDTQAAALAASGRYDEAVVVATAAHKLALRARAYSLAQAINTRLALYIQRRPYVRPSPAVSQIPFGGPSMPQVNPS